MNLEHRKKLSDAKNKYYSQFNGKRPYTYFKDYDGGEIKLKRNALEVIEEFNELYRKHGNITDELVSSLYKNENKEWIIENKFF